MSSMSSMSSDLPLVHIDDNAFPAEPMRCLRCDAEVPLRFAGTCPVCTAELREKMRGEARELEIVEYVPKANVTPNAVAVRE